MDPIELAREITAGRRLTKKDDLRELIGCSLERLTAGADLLRKAFCGEKVDLCTIINARSGLCTEDCRFCAQSVHNNTGCKVHGFLDEEVILRAARAHEAAGVDRFAVVTAGRSLENEDFEKALSAFRRMKQECRLGLCCSLGLLTEEQFIRLREAGVTRFHHNLETSRRNFINICTTHTYDEKIATIRLAQKAGLSVCSGGILGMGETWEDRLDMAADLAELGIQSIPLNILTPIPGSPLEHMKPLPEEEVMRSIAVFRYLNPTANVRLAAGRLTMRENGKYAFCGGASATITGNMLTTSGNTIRGDREMLTALGREVRKRGDE